MFDLGWSEILLIVVVAVVVMGPQDIPKAMMALGRVMRRVQYVKFALSQQFEDIMKEHDLDDLRKANFERARGKPETDEKASDLEDVVIPAKTRTQGGNTSAMDPGLRRDDDKDNDEEGVQ